MENTSLTSIATPIKAKDSIYRSIFFNSANRDFGTNDEPVFVLDPNINAAQKIKLLSVNVPISFYTFNNSNLRVNENTAGSLFSNVVLNGNYTNSQLTSFLSSQLTTASSSTGNSRTYNVAYDSILGKLAIQSTGGSFVVTSGSANVNLGYRSPSQTPSAVQTADSVLQLTKQLLVIQSDELSQSVQTSSRSYYNGSPSDPVVGVVPITNGVYQYQYYESPVSSEYLQANSANLERISFRITDLEGNLISLNGVPFSVKLGLYTDSFH